ncbi:MAG: hypothetical protein K6E67_04505 [Prevotella sp.]|jgi:hypothetical protein|nr:hypothetical protein [Prevotella sp.]
MRQLFLLLSAAIMASCNIGQEGDDVALSVATDWADAYFNCDFHEAASYATAESEQWLRFAASNTTEQDLQTVKGGATATADDYFTVANDTLRVVTLHVRNFLKPVAVGEPAQLQEEGTFLVTVVKRDGKWKVRMEGLPRSEKQSRD